MDGSTAYQSRMQELQQAQQAHAAKITGSPLLQRPQQMSNDMASAPEGAPQKDETQEQMDAFHQTHFGQLTQRFEQEDPHYGHMVKNLTDLAMALKDQVDQGYMPMAVAQQKLHDFIGDHREGYKKGRNKDVLEGQMTGAALQVQQAQQAQQQAQNAIPQAVPDAKITPEDKGSTIAGDEGQGGAA